MPSLTFEATITFFAPPRISQSATMNLNVIAVLQKSSAIGDLASAVKMHVKTVQCYAPAIINSDAANLIPVIMTESKCAVPELMPVVTELVCAATESVYAAAELMLAEEDLTYGVADFISEAA